MDLFSHAEELHTTETSAFEHFITQPWVILAVIAVLVAVVWKWAKPWRMPAILAILFVAGVLTYRWSPWVSVFCISAGFALSLLLTLSVIGNKPAADEDSVE